MPHVKGNKFKPAAAKGLGKGVPPADPTVARALARAALLKREADLEARARREDAKKADAAKRAEDARSRMEVLKQAEEEKKAAEARKADGAEATTAGPKETGSREGSGSAGGDASVGASAAVAAPRASKKARKALAGVPTVVAREGATLLAGRATANLNWAAMRATVAPSRRGVAGAPLAPGAAGSAQGGADGGASAAASARGGTPNGGVSAPSAPSAVAASAVRAALTPIVAIDCEMVGVGPERESALARVCLVNAAGEVVLDEHARPSEPVTDHRTSISGVRPSDLRRAAPTAEVQARVARLLEGRILVGHDLENDLAALALRHPRKLTRDTALYAPLMATPLRGGVGRRKRPLRELALEHLGMTIQEGEHAPAEDARAALYLYLKFRKTWEATRRSAAKAAGVPRAKKANAGMDAGATAAGAWAGPGGKGPAGREGAPGAAASANACADVAPSTGGAGKGGRKPTRGGRASGRPIPSFESSKGQRAKRAFPVR